MVEGGVDLVDAVDPATIGVKGDVARTGAGAVIGEETLVRELASFGVDRKN